MSTPPTTTKHRRSPYERIVSPPPTAGSSPERSQMSTPPVPPSPPPPAHGHPHPGYATYEMPRGFQSGYMYAPPPRQRITRAQTTTPTPTHTHTHHSPSPVDTCPIHSGNLAPMAAPQKNAGPPPAGVQVVHTDDAATNSRADESSCATNAASSERTHSRPRPEQFPHKRGPLASSTLRAPPMHPQPQPQPQTYQPPIAESLSAPAPHHHQDPAPAPPQQYQHQHASVSHPGTPNPNAHNNNNNSSDGRRGEHAEPSASPQPPIRSGPGVEERERQDEEDTHARKVSGKKEVAGRRRRSPANSKWNDGGGREEELETKNAGS
ncbi:hypothetical protein B0H13DRAFT_1880489 [Mycena leptocephala]|nr:hypothetical protein B0H13DRAFT_1880489 [Mycena leptocephala]